MRPTLFAPPVSALVAAVRVVGGLSLVVLWDARQVAAQTAPARATTAEATAEALFRTGRELLLEGQVDLACPKLEESHRLDPATGALLALALCREKQGKLASAWAAFADVEARSRLDGRPDRERTAREHGSFLRPRLSTVTLQVPKEMASVPGFRIAVDNVAIGQAAWNVPIPIDGGDHIVAASAHGTDVWQRSLSLAPERESARVEVPILSKITGEAPKVTKVTPNEAVVLGARRTIGLVAMGVAALALSSSVILALDAKSDYDTAVTECQAQACEFGPYEQAQQARERGDLATAIVIGAGLAGAVGAALWLWPPPRGNRRVDIAAGSIRIGPAGVVVGGRF